MTNFTRYIHNSKTNLGARINGIKESAFYSGEISRLPIRGGAYKGE